MKLFFVKSGLALAASVLLLTLAGCQAATSNTTSVTTTTTTPSVSGTVTLPADLTGKFYAVALMTSLSSGTDHPVSLKTGTVAGSSITYSLQAVTPGTYYLVALVYDSATQWSPAHLGDYVAISGGTLASMPSAANVAVAAGDALTKNLTTERYALSGTGTLVSAAYSVQTIVGLALARAIDQSELFNSLESLFQTSPDGSGHYSFDKTVGEGAVHLVGYATLAEDHKSGGFHYTATYDQATYHAYGVQGTVSGPLTVDGTFVASVSATITGLTGTVSVGYGDSTTAVTFTSFSTGAMSQSMGSPTVDAAFTAGGTAYTYKGSL